MPKKNYPHRTGRQPLVDGGKIKRGFTKEMSNVLNSQVDLCKPDANKKPPLIGHRMTSRGKAGLILTKMYIHQREGR
jgi:hypothetical protein